MKKVVLLVSVFLIIAFAGASCNNSNNSSNGNGNNSVSPSPMESKVAGVSTGDTAEYFSEEAKVMFFYSDYCGWCTKQKEVLKELTSEGYKVKPMNVGKNQDLWKQYNIEGTPTFIAPDGTKLVGYQDKDKLKAFLDKYK